MINYEKRSKSVHSADSIAQSFDGIDSILNRSINFGKEFNKKSIYKNLYWSRIVSLQKWQIGHAQKWPMDTDVQQAIEIWNDIEPDDNIVIKPHFDPEQVAQNIQNWNIDDFRLDENQLNDLAIQVTNIRDNFIKKAQRVKDVNENPPCNVEQTRSRKGMVYSARKNCNDGTNSQLGFICDYEICFPKGKFKKRTLKQLNSNDIINILYALFVEKQTAKDIGKQFRVSHYLVGHLKKQGLQGVQPITVYKEKEQQIIETNQKIKDRVSFMLLNSIPIFNLSQIRTSLEEKNQLSVTNQYLSKVFRKEIGLGYRKVRKVPIQGNSQRNLILRQKYALKMIKLLQEGWKILNVDESFINESNFNRKMWCPTKSPSTVNEKQVIPRLALIAALDIEGQVFFSLNHSNTDSDVMILFLHQLILTLDLEIPDHLTTTIILLDGAKYHTSTEVREFLKKAGVNYMFSAPYSYSTAPIEHLFGGLKTGQLFPYNQSTGKKFLQQMTDMIAKKLVDIPQSTRIRYWHHTTLELYNYLYFQRL